MSSLLWKKKVSQPEVVLPERDAKVLEIYTRRMKRFDEMIKICCCWVGYDILLGIYILLIYHFIIRDAKLSILQNLYLLLVK
jgi:hypothetical protein